MAGLLAIGAAACGDDVEIVQPTPEPPPPPPPLEASMAPASAEVAVGSSVVFAVNASGGVVGEAASWTCASSNTGIATVSVTGSGCQATGVAAGGVTITATVTKGSETANVGSQLTVNAPPPFEATIAPASQSVAVGSSVVFAVNASGGYTGMMGMDDMMMGASWTCASSDDAIATVAVTDAGCQATGVAGGEVTINVAATDGHDTINLVAQLTVTTDPVAAFSAMMSPEEAEVAIGSSVVFAINVSGGAADATAEWTCASSDDAVATAEQTDAGCQATGVAGGGVTINAAVTKGDDSANLASRLTVTAPDMGEPAFVLINTIGGEDDSDTGGLKGRVDVVINVERGDQELEGLSLLVDGAVVASQSFGMAASPAQDEPAEQAVHNFTLSFDSDGYDAETGAVTYMNGEHTIAELEIGIDLPDGTHGHETISSNIVPVEFNNPDGYIVTADLGDNSALDSAGKRWYGGPTNGMITIAALPVNYSGGSVSTVTVTLGDCGNKTDMEAPFSVEFDCKDKEGTQTISVSSAGGPAGTILNADDVPEANIDNVGPTEAPTIIANRNGREEGWINAAVGIAGEFHSTRGKDNWLVEGDDETMGVGGYNMAIRIGEDLEEAVGDDAMSSLPAESDGADDYCAVAVATDDLGNMTELPDADDDTCRVAPDGADVMLTYDPAADGGTDTITVYGYDADSDDDQDPNTGSGDVSQADGTLQFGVDTTNPVIELGEEEPDMRFTALPFPGGAGLAFDANDDENDAGNSGLLEEGGILVKVGRRTATKSDCALVQGNGTVRGGADKDCDYMAITDEDVNFEADSISVAYYTVSAMAKDKAGNTSTAASHTLVYDNDEADATAPSVPGVVAAGKTFSGSVYLNDNLSIRDYYGTMNYGTDAATIGFRLGIGAPVAVDAFNSSSLTRLNHQVSQTVGIVTGATSVADPYKALQAALGGDRQPLTTVSAFVRDQTQAAYGAGMASGAVTQTDAAGDDDDFDTGVFSTAVDTDGYAFRGLGDDDDYEVCGYAKCDDDDLKSTLKIEVRTVAPEPGAFSDPFERVDFWVTDINGASWRIGSDTSGTSGRLGGAGTTDADNPRNRTWSYSITVAGTMLRAATRQGTGGTGTPAILAIGVNDEGVGLVESVELANEDFGTEETDD